MHHDDKYAEIYSGIGPLRPMIQDELRKVWFIVDRALNVPDAQLDLFFFWVLGLPLILYIHFLFAALHICFKGPIFTQQRMYIWYRDLMLRWIQLKKAVRQQRRG